MKRGQIHRHFSSITYKDLDMYSVLYHPRYFEFADTARNQAFKDFGYPIEEQLKDKVGFTVASINNVAFKRPLFMSEVITIFTEVTSVSIRSCEVLHWINLGEDHSEATTDSIKFVKAIFKAEYDLVFVDISGIPDFPLNCHNINQMKTVPFNEKVKKNLLYS